MGWTNVSGSQIALTRNVPPQRCFSVIYINWKAQFQGTVSLERWQEGSSSGVASAQMTADPTASRGQTLAAQVNLSITDDLQAGFELNEERGQALVQSVQAGGGSPRAFGNAILNCLSLKQKLNLLGHDFTIGVAPDTELCFFSIQVPLAQWQPEFPEFSLHGQTTRVRANLQGTATFKFGLSQLGWQWLRQRVGVSALRPLLQRLGQIVGRAALRIIATSAGVTMVSVVGGILGGVGLAYLSARFTDAARQSGRYWAHCGQYALGYVSTAWLPYGSGLQPEEAALDRACGPLRTGHTGDQIRLIGVSEAISDIEEAGGDVQGAQAVRRELLRRLGITDIDPQTQLSSTQQQRVVRVLEEHLRAR